MTQKRSCYHKEYQGWPFKSQCYDGAGLSGSEREVDDCQPMDDATAVGPIPLCGLVMPNDSSNVQTQRKPENITSSVNISA